MTRHNLRRAQAAGTLNKEGPVRSRHGSPWTRQDAAQLLQLHEAGHSASVIATSMGRDHRTIERRLRRLSDEGTISQESAPRLRV
ncbi:MAG: helix-turn-helix domain-containing protein [Candidatus Berkelbacteria bacterium]|nr:helix-turn-helix domain-containing protein [Candidatus Berkelbacteria bacterium]